MPTKVKFLRSVSLSGSHCEAGSVQLLDDATARELISYSAAEEAAESAESAESVESVVEAKPKKSK